MASVDSNREGKLEPPGRREVGRLGGWRPQPLTRRSEGSREDGTDLLRTLLMSRVRSLALTGCLT